MAEGIHRVLESSYWVNTVFPDFKDKYAIDAGKIEKEQAGNKRPLPTSAFARGIVEELRAHPKVVNPSTNFGLWEEPVVLLHSPRGGVEYWDEQKKYFGSVSLDLNNPGEIEDGDPLTSPWIEKYIPTANSKGLKWTWWKHAHNYADVQELLDKIKLHPLKTGGLNLESIVFEGMTPPRIAAMIDETLGTDSVLLIPTLGWMDGIRWDALNRHVFQLEFFLNDPPDNGDWEGIPYVELAKQLAEHARVHCGAKKINFLCGVYPPRPANPYGKVVSAETYKAVIKEAGERFGGIYLGDNNGPNYQKWEQ